MSPREVSLVQNTFHQLIPITDQAAALFYARLFELDPTLRALFDGDMREQGRKLMQSLALTVGSLNQFEALLPAVRQLGVRHASYGVRDEHYATVGTALLWTLEKCLGGAFTAAAKAAWTNTYVALANAMMDGAHGTELTTGLTATAS
jgi:hemoglobin-like flavoprotein